MPNDDIVFDYQVIYERIARQYKGTEAIGHGDFEKIGMLELEDLKSNGLQPNQSLLDLGCGIGRLAQFAIRYLSAGTYTGLDVAPTMIQRATKLCDSIQNTCRIQWIVQKDVPFEFADNTFDMTCAYSVFTHMEHEDAFRYLREVLRIVKPNGKFLYSCLPIDTEGGKTYFLEMSKYTLAQRWGSLPIIVTSKDLMIAISELAGWHVMSWAHSPVGQTLCVLQKPS